MELADPLPERRLARLLAAFIGAGLWFLVFPGTLVGVWNLVGISSQRDAAAVSVVWLQAHGHAQLFGWVGTFIIGISLYTVPKFRGAWLRSLTVGWIMLLLWTGAILARWLTAVAGRGWEAAWPASAVAELSVALLLVWQTTPSAPSRRRTEFWERLIFTGFAGLIAALALQTALMGRLGAEPALPHAGNQILLHLALWFFCFPAVWGFSARFLPSLLGLAPPDSRSAYAGLALLAASVPFAVTGREPIAAALTLGAVLLACWSLRIFRRGVRPPKVRGIDPRYPWFARAALGWLVVSAVLGLFTSVEGMLGASRHAFTVGFLATLILAIGPRILPSFLNSRELHSSRLVLVSLTLLTAGCVIRVASEPLAYAGALPAAWLALPLSALLELSAILLFAWNIARTLAAPMPVWIELSMVDDSLSLYWLVSSYPETRRVLAEAGLRTLEHARELPRLLTVGEAARAEGIDTAPLVAALRAYFQRRLARALR